MRNWLLAASALFLFSFHLDKKKTFIPPGTLQINDTLYADINEVTNLSWMEYAYWISNVYGPDSPASKAAQPDSSLWHYDGMNSNQPWESSYRSKTFRDFPVSCISYEQAVAFCKWRTDRVKYFLSASGKYTSVDFYYRLPSKAEWEFLCDGSHGVSFKEPEIKSSIKGNSRTSVIGNVGANFRLADSLWSNHPERTASFKPNLLGLYDMSGNVAEMVLEKNIAKGGSWFHSAEDSRPGKNQDYEGPRPWLGFRCVCIVRAHKGA